MKMRMKGETDSMLYIIPLESLHYSPQMLIAGLSLTIRHVAISGRKLASTRSIFGYGVSIAAVPTVSTLGIFSCDDKLVTALSRKDGGRSGMRG
jgi:hypothetical protein